MKKTILFLKLLLLIWTTKSIAQTNLKQYRAGHAFDIGLPDYLSKTSGLNSSAAIQYQNKVKEIYGFVIFDTKEELELAEMKYTSINEFYEDFMKDFLKDEKSAVSKPVFQKIGDINFVECDVVFTNEEEKTEIYYLVGIVETKNSFYKVLTWTAAEDKNKYKDDFKKIVYSLKD
ncbi:hypothetical protein BXU11_13075 [Flavobacterium sp. LM5]|uniref:hypothetical protein n=1 Tax=Flavobacterium sp. LM5 TaxID=1938610 RepID=UPI000991E112|nr:hypothetical protein [Flavobacterium sp. LM5]OOV26409.1 hypothetical protein BXU11_13075 [Flavobacterium sp. LM5]